MKTPAPYRRYFGVLHPPVKNVFSSVFNCRFEMSDRKWVLDALQQHSFIQE